MMISLLCLFITLFLYIFIRRQYLKTSHWWLMPVFAVSLSLVLFLTAARISYGDYFHYNRWLLWLLGPVMVAFAVPLYQHRQMVKDHKLSLSIGVVVGVIMAISTSLILAKIFQVPSDIQKSLLVRSVSIPFAMNVSQNIGGSPNQAAIFVVFTGLFGNLTGVFWISFFKIRSAMAKGAMLGAVSHGIGAAKAFEISGKAGVVASLVMMISGIITMLLAPVIALL